MKKYDMKRHLRMINRLSQTRKKPKPRYLPISSIIIHGMMAAMFASTLMTFYEHKPCIHEKVCKHHEVKK